MLNLKTKATALGRIGFGVMALALTLAVASPAATYAAGQVVDRSITISDSSPSASGVSYKLSFTPQTSETSGEIIVDFCSNSPIPGDSCTANGGVNVPDVSGVSGGTAVSDGASSHTVKITGQSLTASTPVTITLSGIANPSSVGTFYARVFTYASGGSAAYVPKANAVPNEGSYVDYGGVALSTVNTIDITAKVQETLTFCVSGTDLTSSGSNNHCSDATTPSVTLGHGSPTKTLDNSAVDTGSIFSHISTNALSGAAIDLKNSNSCGGLSADGGSACNIPATNSGSGAAAAGMSAGTAGFGLNVSNGTPSSGGTGTVTADANYAGTNTYGMDTKTTGDADPTSVTSLFGDRVAYSSAPLSQVNNTYKFAGAASLTTPAGIYTADMDLIATGTF